MVADVLAGLRLMVALQPETEPFERAHQSHAGKTVVDLFIARMNEVHERLQIRRGPPFVEIGIAKAQIAFADQSRKQIVVVDAQFRHRAGPGPFGAKHAPVAQNEIHPPILQVFRLRKDLRKIARQVVLPVRGGEDHVRSRWRHFDFSMRRSDTTRVPRINNLKVPAFIDFKRPRPPFRKLDHGFRIGVRRRHAPAARNRVEIGQRVLMGLCAPFGNPA